MICKNCGGEFEEGLLQCPYCGTEDTKEAVEQQKEYIEEYEEKIDALKEMPEHVAKKGKSKVTKIILLLVVLFVIVCIVVVIISSMIGAGALERQEKHLAKLEELYQAKDFEELQSYYEKIDIRGGTFEKYDRVIDVYRNMFYIDALKSDYEYVRDYSQRLEEITDFEDNLSDVFKILYEIKLLEEEGFPYNEGEAILYLKDLYMQALKEYALLTDEEIKQGILSYENDTTDYSELEKTALNRLNEKFH